VFVLLTIPHRPDEKVSGTNASGVTVSGVNVRFRLPLLLLLAAAVLVVVPGVAFGAHDEPAQATAVYTVRPGDTLWHVARRLDPAGDPRPLVDQLMRSNDLGAGLRAGQELRVPADLPGTATLTRE
jgi:hypothetical protein